MGKIETLTLKQPVFLDGGLAITHLNVSLPTPRALKAIPRESLAIQARDRERYRHRRLVELATGLPATVTGQLADEDVQAVLDRVNELVAALWGPGFDIRAPGAIG